MAKEATTYNPAQEHDPKLELQETNARLVATRNGIESLKEEILDLESEVPIHLN